LWQGYIFSFWPWRAAVATAAATAADLLLLLLRAPTPRHLPLRKVDLLRGSVLEGPSEYGVSARYGPSAFPLFLLCC
jgi:hypothetical protein